MFRFHYLTVAFALTILTSAASADQNELHMEIGDPARSSHEVGLTLDGITDTATGDIITPQEMAERLTDIGLLFVGEIHTNLDSHRVQLRVIQELHRAGREVMIGLEMFPTTQQSSLDAWVDNVYTEKGFVAEADWYNYWGYHWEYYREIFLYARDNGIRMYGINTPRDIVKAVREKDFKDLTADESKYFEHEVKPATDDQTRMFRSFFDAEDALHLSDDAMGGMLRAQTTWDATMGWNALRALKNYGGDNAIMIVLIGVGHVTYGLGSERQTAPYYDGKIASLITEPIEDEDGQPVETVRASYANFLWGIPGEQDTVYPTLGVSLMGKRGKQPTRLIQVHKDSVAKRAGLAVGDVLLAIGDQPIDSGRTLTKIFSRYRWGDVVTIKIEREGEIQDLIVPIRRNATEGTEP
jgi:uncharacterized iron-regulated protein